MLVRQKNTGASLDIRDQPSWDSHVCRLKFLFNFCNSLKISAKLSRAIFLLKCVLRHNFMVKPDRIRDKICAVCYWPNNSTMDWKTAKRFRCQMSRVQWVRSLTRPSVTCDKQHPTFPGLSESSGGSGLPTTSGHFLLLFLLTKKVQLFS